MFLHNDDKLQYINSFDRDSNYWNEYYSAVRGVIEPSLFAQFLQERLVAGKKILDLGCGNGRDSVFFAHRGLDVTGIDASDKAISQNKQMANDDDITFICADFVNADIMKKQKFDYCYSRFSIHAITSAQEIKLLQNVYNCLNDDGWFFIESRSIHDPLYLKGIYVEKNSYVFDGHFRRFIDKEELKTRLTIVGFNVEYCAEEKGFAPFDKEDPPVIRIFAHKVDKI